MCVAISMASCHSSGPPRHRLRLPRGLIEPCAPTLVRKPPCGPIWTHEIKRDGYRIMAYKQGGDGRLLSRNGLDWAHAFTGIVEAIRGLPAATVILDGEAVVLRPDGHDDFHALRSRSGCHGASFVAFDVLEMDGENLRGLFLDARRVVLKHVLLNAQGPCILSEALEEPGPLIFQAASRLGLEGIISKRRDAPYRSGRTTSWVKSKSASYTR